MRMLQFALFDRNRKTPHISYLELCCKINTRIILIFLNVNQQFSSVYQTCRKLLFALIFSILTQKTKTKYKYEMELLRLLLAYPVAAACLSYFAVVNVQLLHSVACIIPLKGAFVIMNKYNKSNTCLVFTQNK